MNNIDRQANIHMLEASITEHEHIIDTLHEKIDQLYEAEWQDNIKLFRDRTGLTIDYGDVLNVTAQFVDYAVTFLTTEDRHEHLKLWNQRKKGNLTIYNYELNDVLEPIVSAQWEEIEYQDVGGHYFQNGIMPVTQHIIYFYNTPIEIIKSCIKGK